MSTLKNKILNHKPKPDPQLWEKIEGQVSELNQVKSNSRFLPKHSLSILIAVSTFAIIYFGTQFIFLLEQKMEVNLNTKYQQEHNKVTKNQALSINDASKNVSIIRNRIKQNSEIIKVSKDTELNKSTQTSFNGGKGLPNNSKRLTLTSTAIPAYRNADSKDTDLKLGGTNQQIALSNKVDIGITTNIEPFDQIQNTLSKSLLQEKDSNALNLKQIQLEGIHGISLNKLTIPFLDGLALENLYSKSDLKDKLSPCNPPPLKQNFIEIGGSFGFGTHLYPGYFTNFMLDFRLNKLVGVGVKINHQRYTDAAKFITAPDILNSERYTNLLANISFILLENNKISLGIDLSPGLGLVTENQRKQNGDDFYILKHQYYGFNYMVGAHLDYRILKRWKLGWESVVDANGETTLHGLRIKFVL